ncbi:MAG: DNA/RNA non-specific endonuclease [Endozoicomonas sp.]|uniref:DNA/RNA non-specific endonuclease n=1 Tax=Endozoicomonas sp. TaxID=1892382 RepID=UPI003D9B9162
MYKIMIWALAFNSTVALADNCGRYGCPAGSAPGNQLLERPIYTLSNNAQTKFADWLAYRVHKQNLDGPKRSRNWKSDPNLSASSTLEPADYKYAHATIQTDRGHQVPLGAFSNSSYWYMTNYLSNITPQSSNLNQGPWVNLELSIRDLARTGTPAYVITGPLYEYAELPNADEYHRIRNS